MIAPPLYRLLGRKTVHLATCQHVIGNRICWVWAQGRTVDEVRKALIEQGGTECSTCQPLTMAVSS